MLGMFAALRAILGKFHLILFGLLVSGPDIISFLANSTLKCYLASHL